MPARFASRIVLFGFGRPSTRVASESKLFIRTWPSPRPWTWLRISFSAVSSAAEVWPARCSGSWTNAEWEREAARRLADLGIEVPSITGPVENLSGGQRQGVAVARASAWATRVVILDEPTAALGVRETARVLALIRRIRERGLSVVLVSHDMPHVFELADRIQVMRLGRRAATITPRTHTMADAVALMTGALTGEASRASPGRPVS